MQSLQLILELQHCQNCFDWKKFVLRGYIVDWIFGLLKDEKKKEKKSNNNSVLILWVGKIKIYHLHWRPLFQTLFHM